MLRKMGTLRIEGPLQPGGYTWSDGSQTLVLQSGEVLHFPYVSTTEIVARYVSVMKQREKDHTERARTTANLIGEVWNMPTTY